MQGEISALREHPVFRHFWEICRIPHGSGRERALSDRILAWAGEQGLEAEQDTFCNVLVRKPASPGLENAPGVMLQAHLDMVCEKAAGVEHDFTSDPIQWVVEGDVLSTGGRTTLGADDGLGVALILALLEDPGPVHPPLEALFTTNEEEDMSGAEGFDCAAMNSRYLINLDNTLENQILCGSCGGIQADVRIPLPTAPVPGDQGTYRLSVSGLRGGHSGEDIHRGRGNANQMLTRLLLAVCERWDTRLVSIRGGSFRLAIPRDAEAVFTFPREAEGEVRQVVERLQEDFRRELALTADGVTVKLEPAEPASLGALPDRVLDALTLAPDGICQMNEALTGLVDTSDNLGEVYLEGEQLHLVLEIRSARESLRTWVVQRLERLAKLLGGTLETCRSYPSWNFRPRSRLRDTVAREYRAFYGGEPDIRTVHAGLEVGYLLSGKPEVDAVSLGPDCWDFHSPSESLRISSAKKFLPYLQRIVAALAQPEDAGMKE